MSVYFAQAGAYIKIGYSADPMSRMTTVTTNGKRPDDLPRGCTADLIGWVPGGRDVERAMHERYAACRVAGEWFDLDAVTAADLIWADPRGVDFGRMSMVAVVTMSRRPDLTREQVAASGIQVEATPLDEALKRVDELMRRSA